MEKIRFDVIPYWWIIWDEKLWKEIRFYMIPNRWLHLSVLVLSTSLSGTCHIRHFTIWFYKWQLSCQIYCPRYCMLLCGLAKLVMLKKTFWFAFYSMHMGCFLATFQQAAGSWKALQRASAERSWRSRGIIQLRCRVWHFGFETSRFRNFSIFFDGIGIGFGNFWYRKKYRYRFRKKIGIRKSIGIGFDFFWYRKKYRYRFRNFLVSKKVSVLVLKFFWY